MKSVFLILIHTNSNLLRRLINRLHSDHSTIFIHLDLKVDIKLFQEYQQYPNVKFIKNRVKVGWGAYSMVQCMINSFREIVPQFNQDQYVSLISGQDYPLMKNEEMVQFLSDNQGKAFMEFYPIYQEWKEAIPRLEKFHLTNFKFLGVNVLERYLNKLVTRRVPPQELIFVGRSQWFTITIEQIDYILNYLKSHSSIRRFFALTWGSDEIVFQTILYNSKYKEQMCNDNLRYIDWTKGGASPKILKMQDASQIENSRKFFARKFDMNVDSEILDWIDENLLNNKK